MWLALREATRSSTELMVTGGGKSSLGWLWCGRGECKIMLGEKACARRAQVPWPIERNLNHGPVRCPNVEAAIREQAVRGRLPRSPHRWYASPPPAARPSSTCQRRASLLTRPLSARRLFCARATLRTGHPDRLHPCGPCTSPEGFPRGDTPPVSRHGRKTHKRERHNPAPPYWHPRHWWVSPA